MRTQGRGMTILSYRQSIGPFKWTTLLMPISIIAIVTPVMGYCCPRNLKPILDAWQTSSWSIFLVSMFCTVGWDYWTRAGQCRAMLPYKSRHLYPNEVLIYHGYIGCSPLHPTVAVSLCTLSTYHQVHCICPQFGIQAQCKLLCYWNPRKAHDNRCHTSRIWTFNLPLLTTRTSISWIEWMADWKKHLVVILTTGECLTVVLPVFINLKVNLC